MNTPANAPELFESSVKESLYSCFCSVCLFVVVFCLVLFCCCFFFFAFAFCFVLLFFILRIEKKKSGIWRREVNYLQNKLSDVIVLGRVNLIRSP